MDKYGVASGTTSSRIIVVTRLYGYLNRVVKTVQLQAREAMGNTNSGAWDKVSSQIDGVAGVQGYSGVPFLYESSRWTSPKIYFESVVETGTANTYGTVALFKLVDGGANDVIVDGSQVWTGNRHSSTCAAARSPWKMASSISSRQWDTTATASSSIRARLVIYLEGTN